ncbi:MAG: hypothetical protein ABIX01_05640 [Chitinophagaceae bacterium]
MRPALKKTLVAVGILAVGGLVFFFKTWYAPHRDVRDEKAVVVSANDLLKAFVANEKDLKYLDKALDVSGIVEETKTNQAGKTVCLLKTEDDFAVINCTFKDSIAVTAGQQVSITGICTGYLTGADVVMIDCYPSEPGKK